MTIVVKNGRLIDPESGRDERADLVIHGDRIARIGHDLDADAVLDAEGLIVGPGFVDLHSHVHSIPGQLCQAFDGVTTALDLEAGLMPVARAYDDAAREGRPLNYGFSASWTFVRGLVIAGVPPDADFSTAVRLLGDTTWQRPASAQERARMISRLEAELADGALGIGAMIGYIPDLDPGEYLDLAHLARRAEVPLFTHARDVADPANPSAMDGPAEIVRTAAETGAHLHFCHVNSTSGRQLDRALALLEESRRAGSTVSVEAYPYGAGCTPVGAAFLAPELLAKRGVQPSSLVMVSSGERVRDIDRLRAIRTATPGDLCLVETFDESDSEDRAQLFRAIIFPDTIIASDAIPLSQLTNSVSWPLDPATPTHPRTSGAFTKTLRVMVRETEMWTWTEAFRRCSYLPTQVLKNSPALQRKGRIQVGADADLVIIDPHTVSDTATYRAPASPAVGVIHLLVGGTPVIRDGALVPGVLPGRGLRGSG